MLACARKALVPVLAVVALACNSAPDQPLGTLSSEQAQKLILERDAARDALATREREFAAEIERLQAEIRELRSAPAAADVEEEAAAEIAPAAASEIAVEMQNLSARPIEANKSWTRFSWQGVVHNNLDRPISVNAVVVFQDAGGFELEKIDNRLTLQPFEFRKISGVEMVDAQVAASVSKVAGRVEK